MEWLVQLTCLCYAFLPGLETFDFLTWQSGQNGAVWALSLFLVKPEQARLRDFEEFCVLSLNRKL
jgi:hypothetical protein